MRRSTLDPKETTDTKPSASSHTRSAHGNDDDDDDEAAAPSEEQIEAAGAPSLLSSPQQFFLSSTNTEETDESNKRQHTSQRKSPPPSYGVASVAAAMPSPSLPHHQPEEVHAAAYKQMRRSTATPSHSSGPAVGSESRRRMSQFMFSPRNVARGTAATSLYGRAESSRSSRARRRQPPTQLPAYGYPKYASMTTTAAGDAASSGASSYQPLHPQLHPPSAAAAAYGYPTYDSMTTAASDAASSGASAYPPQRLQLHPTAASAAGVHGWYPMYAPTTTAPRDPSSRATDYPPPQPQLNPASATATAYSYPTYASMTTAVGDASYGAFAYPPPQPQHHPVAAPAAVATEFTVPLPQQPLGGIRRLDDPRYTYQPQLSPGYDSTGEQPSLVQRTLGTVPHHVGIAGWYPGLDPMATASIPLRSRQPPPMTGEAPIIPGFDVPWNVPTLSQLSTINAAAAMSPMLRPPLGGAGTEHMSSRELNWSWRNEIPIHEPPTAHSRTHIDEMVNRSLSLPDLDLRLPQDRSVAATVAYEASAAEPKQPDHTATTTRTEPLQLPAVLGHQDTDELYLSGHQVFLRQQVEVFEATEEDVATNTRGRNRLVVIGQVGIRCRHCANVPASQRQKGTMYFPATLNALYQAVQNMGTNHIQCGVCRYMPDSIKEEFKVLIPTKNLQSRAGRFYWADSARQLGLVDTDDGIAFRPSGAPPIVETTAHAQR